MKIYYTILLGLFAVGQSFAILNGYTRVDCGNGTFLDIPTLDYSYYYGYSCEELAAFYLEEPSRPGACGRYESVPLGVNEPVQNLRSNLVGNCVENILQSDCYAAEYQKEKEEEIFGNSVEQNVSFYHFAGQSRCPNPYRPFPDFSPIPRIDPLEKFLEEEAFRPVPGKDK